MKRGTPNHPKMDWLCDLLGVKRPTAMGHLEALWHFTSTYAPRGNIGRFHDKDIARQCYWEGDPSHFVESLVEAGWVDRCIDHRLVVHDWHEHADEATKKRLQRAGEAFLTASKPCLDNGRQRPPTSAVAGSHVRLPEPEPEPEPEPTPTAAPDAVVVGNSLVLSNQKQEEGQRLLSERGLSAAQAQFFAGRVDPASLEQVLSYHANLRGTLKNPVGALKSMLAHPEKWNFDRSPDGALMRPAGSAAQTVDERINRLMKEMYPDDG